MFQSNVLLKFFLIREITIPVPEPEINNYITKLFVQCESPKFSRGTLLDTMINTFEGVEGKQDYSPGFVLRGILSEFGLCLTPNQVERMMLILEDHQIEEVNERLNQMDGTGWF